MTISNSQNLEGKIERKGRKLSPLEIEEILDSYKTYEGNAYRASKEIPYTQPRIIRHWREARYEIRLPGGRLRKEQKERDNKVKKMLKKGYKQTEIARRLNISRQAVYDYIGKRPKLREIYDSRRKEK